jgi:hypothetical protein
VGRRPAAGHPLARHDHLRIAREGLHDAPSAGAGGAARDLRRPGAEPVDVTCALGVTAVELLPVHYHFVDERLVLPGAELLGLQHARLLRAGAALTRRADARARWPDEFKQMVRAMHAAGIEVILDVVYNHTAEGDERGPTLSFRGIDNAAYYRLAEDRARYVDFTGCGNSLNMSASARAPADHGFAALLGAGDARGWVPLRPGQRAGPRAVGRGRLGAFFDIIQQDPVLSQVKLIAEPWDVGPGGYRWAISRASGRSGMESTATVCGAFGRGMAAPWASWPRGSPGAAISIATTAGARARA